MTVLKDIKMPSLFHFVPRRRNARRVVLSPPWKRQLGLERSKSEGSAPKDVCVYGNTGGAALFDTIIPREINPPRSKSEGSAPENNDVGYRVTYRVNGDNHPLKSLSGKQRAAEYKKSCAQITISVGCSDAHTGKHFRDTLENAAETFEKTVIMLDDSVQWRTLRITYPDMADRELQAKAIEEGDNWLLKHKPYIDACVKRYGPEKVKIQRWKDWEGTLERQMAVNLMKQLYDANAEMRAAIHETAEEFYKRTQRRSVLPRQSKEEIVQMSVDYLIEECGVMAYLWPKLGANFELYPSLRTVAMAKTYELLIEPTQSKVLVPLEISFKQRKLVKDSENVGPPEVVTGVSFGNR